MKNKLIVAAVAATTFGLAAAGTAGAAGHEPGQGGRCVKEGTSIFRGTVAPDESPNFLVFAAKNGLVGSVVRDHALNPGNYVYC